MPQMLYLLPKTSYPGSVHHDDLSSSAENDGI